MVLNLQRAGDLTDQFYKVLLYGDSGVGKTWAAATAPSPAVCLVDPIGWQAVRLSNPDARVGRGKEIQYVREFIMAAQAGEFAQAGIKTLVFDSGSEIQRLMKDEILAQKDPLDQHMAQQDWNTLTERMRRWLRIIRDLPFNIVVTALAEWKTDETGKVLKMLPAFQGRKLPFEVPQYFNVVGYVDNHDEIQEDGETVTIHHIKVSGETRYMLKNQYPLRGQLEPNLSAWFEALQNAGTKHEAAV